MSILVNMLLNSTNEFVQIIQYLDSEVTLCAVKNDYNTSTCLTNIVRKLV